MDNVFDDKDILRFALENDIINLDDVQREMTKKHRETMLEKHTHHIWQGKDSRYRTYIDDPDSKKRRLIVKTHEKDLLDFLVGHYTTQEEAYQIENLSLEGLYPRWLEHKSLRTTAQNYITRINNDWNKYYSNTDIIRVPIRKLDKLTLDDWAHQLIHDYDMTSTQYYNCTIIMRQGLDYAVDLGIIKTNPFQDVKIDAKRMFRVVRKKTDSTQVFLKDELPVIHDLALKDFHSGTRKKRRLAPLAVLFQFQTGIRIGELCVCQFDDIENEDFIHIQRMYRCETGEVVEHTKTLCGDRLVFLTEQAKDYIEMARRFQQENGIDSRYIFSDDGEPLSKSSINYLYGKYCKEAGITHKSSHKARKTYISALIDGQVNINTIRKMVGHTDERTTFGNYCFDRSTEAEKEKKTRV